MEIAAVIKEIKDNELRLESSDKETIVIPKSMVAAAQVGQTVYLSCSDEPNKAPRELLNELLGSDESQ